MERVAFLVEQTGERISCLLNPEFVETRRRSGLSERRDAAGFLASAARTDHPMVATGGGVTEIDLRLLFDTELAELELGSRLPTPPGLAGPPPRPSDVRELTRPIWNLSENASAEGFSAPPSVRFIWGKSWNVPGVIVYVAERLERFDAGGAPQRSWLSMRLRRVEEPDPRPASPLPVTPQFEAPFPTAGSPQEEYRTVTVPADTSGAPLARLDQICAEHYGNPALAPVLGDFNRLDDLLSLPPGGTLSLPPAQVLTGAP
jgi:hypothetical protein